MLAAALMVREGKSKQTRTLSEAPRSLCHIHPSMCHWLLLSSLEKLPPQILNINMCLELMLLKVLEETAEHFEIYSLHTRTGRMRVNGIVEKLQHKHKKKCNEVPCMLPSHL